MNIIVSVCLQPNQSQHSEFFLLFWALAVCAICEEVIQYSVPVCHCASCYWCPRSHPPHRVSCPPLSRMDDSRYTRGQSFGCGPTSFLSLPHKHNSELSHRSPNKCYNSCIFNLLTDAIILYMPCSLILMQLLLFMARRFLPPILSFESASALNVCVCTLVKAAGPIRAGQQQS